MTSLRKALTPAALIIAFLSVPAARAQTTDDAAAARQLVADYCQAQADFPHTRDLSTVFRFYAPDYFEIAEGRINTYKDVDAQWRAFKQELDLGSDKRFSITCSDVNVKVIGDGAYATFGADVKTGKRGKAEIDRQGICSEVLERREGKWLITQENCSWVPPKSRGPFSF